MNKNKRLIRKGDLIVLIAALIIGGLIFGHYLFQSQRTVQGSTLKITNTATNEIETYSLNHNMYIKIEGPIGIATIELADGAARFLDSPCPDQICIHVFGWISQEIDKSFCLPNQIMLEIEK